MLDIRKSEIHNKGVFARKNIKRGAFVIEYVGRKISSEEADRICERTLEDSKKDNSRASTYIFELDKKYCIDGDVPYNIAKYINHSCDPNCKYEIRKGRIWIKAFLDIKKGEELTYSYDFDIEDDYTEYPCRCGSKDCPGFILAKKFWPKIRKKKD